MGSVKCHISISFDGYVAGPNQSLENPIGGHGMRLHQWHFDTEPTAGSASSIDAQVAEEVAQGVGAYIMGRKMFGGGASS